MPSAVEAACKMEEALTPDGVATVKTFLATLMAYHREYRRKIDVGQFLKQYQAATTGYRDGKSATPEYHLMKQREWLKKKGMSKTTLQGGSTKSV